MIAKEFIDMIDKVLKGEYDVNDFSYDFTDKLIELSDKLEEENKELYDLLAEEIPDLCGNFEPYEVDRKGNDFLLDKDQFLDKMKIEYEKALKLM
ncbi:hypothetical protein [Clostridium sp.]|uniref:hypothetical protein n=1 Tax=Clostridium sp. TaxID=1506 RepID=UPI0032164B37